MFYAEPVVSGGAPGVPDGAVWIVYLLIALAAVAALAFSLISAGVFAVVVVLLVLVYAGVFILGLRGARVEVSGHDTGVPTSHEASYHPEANPRQTGSDT
jgi:uncharacterized protein (DUF58 family)